MGFENQYENKIFEGTRDLNFLLDYPKVFLYGIGNQCKECYEFFETKKKEITLFDGKKDKWGAYYQKHIINSPDKILDLLDSDTAIVISSIYNQYEIATYLKREFGILDKQMFCYTSEVYNRNVLDSKKILENKENILSVIEQLADEESKKYYIGSLKMRLQRNPLRIEPNKNCRIIGEYAGKVQLQKGDTIIDCGAYTGDTAEMYYNYLDGECTVFAIEPFQQNYEEMVKRVKLNNYENNIFPYNYAVSNTEGEAIIAYNDEDFAMTTNINHRFEGKQKQVIKMSTIDTLFMEKEKIDYLKMDIEGEEAKALKGAEKILLRDKPKLMISAYHKIEDFWVIPQLIKAINPEYKIYVGHAPGVSMEMEYYCIEDDAKVK